MDAFLASLAATLLDVIRPLELSVQSPGNFGAMMLQRGWTPPADPGFITPLAASLDLASQIEQAEAAIEDLIASDEVSVADVEAALAAAIAIVQDVVTLANAPANLAAYPPLDSPAFWQDFARQLATQLFADYLQLNRPGLYAPLHLLGVIDRVHVAGGGPGRVDHEETQISWDRLGTLVSDPGSLARQVYGWGGAFDAGELLLRLQRALAAWEIPAGAGISRHPLIPYYYAGGSPFLPVAELRIPLLDLDDPDLGRVQVGLTILPIPPEPVPSTAAPSGFLVGPYVRGNVGETIPLEGPFSLELRGGLDAEDPVGIEIRPGAARAKLTDLGTTIDVAATLRGTPSQPWILLGAPGASRLEAADVAVGLELKGPVADPELRFATRTTRIALIVDFSEGDGFLTSIFGADPQTLQAQIGVLWSSKGGLSFEGQGALAATVPVNQTIGPVEISSISVGLALATNGDVGGFVAVTGGLTLGPVAASVDKVGVQVALEPKPGGGAAFGTLDLDFGFKPPNGLGIELDAVAIKGGGYIQFDDAKKQYAGILELSLEDLVQLKVIGILDTILPGGQPGISLLLIITADFEPIQLGFGFTLNGVGGLAGINRTMLLDAIRAGLRNRTLDSILFPPDPIANAPKIISDLSAIFPPAAGRYAFGPQLKIGWGTPALITASVGIFIELPPPIRLAILAQIKTALPTAEAALIEINMDAVGTYEQEKKRLAVDATLYDSKIAGFPLTGDMAMRLTWGTQPFFALSVGGFNPRYTIPGGVEFPQLRRLELSMGSGGVRMNLAAYFAVTSNTVQVGAHLELRVGDGAGLHGWMGFDALFVFSPFSFVVDISAGVDLVVGGDAVMTIHLNFTLSGPTPWHAWGDASIDLFFFSISVPFNARWGSDQDVSLPDVDVRTPLLAAFGDPRNWAANPPADRELAATLRAVRPPKVGATDEEVILAHPFSRLTVRERLVPLDLRIEKFGNAAPAKWNQFRIVSALLDGATMTPDPVQDYFARAQFVEMSNDEKLSRQSFELLDAGAAFGSDDVKPGSSSPLEVHYETFIVDDPLLPSRRGALYRLGADRFFAQLGAGAAARSKVWTSGPRKYVEADSESAVTVLEQRYVIASSEDLTLRSDLLGAAASQIEAEQALADHLASTPGDRGRLQVVPAQEALT